MSKLDEIRDENAAGLLTVQEGRNGYYMGWDAAIALNLPVKFADWAKIGIDVTFVGNIPWIYLDTVNGVKVRTKYLGNHGFTVFWSSVRAGGTDHITDISLIFNTIRNILKQQCDERNNSKKTK